MDTRSIVYLAADCPSFLTQSVKLIKVCSNGGPRPFQGEIMGIFNNPPCIIIAMLKLGFLVWEWFLVKLWGGVSDMVHGPFGVFLVVPLEKFLFIIWERYHYRWKAAFFSQYSALMTICIEQREFFCMPHTHCETGQFLRHFEQQLTLY